MNESNSTISGKSPSKSLQIQDIHTSWIKQLPNGELIEKLRETPSSRASLSEFIKQYLPLNEINDADEFTKELLLSDPEDLHEVVLKAGVTQFSNNIRLIITKKAVITLKESLGEDLYNFSLNEASNITQEVEVPSTQKFMEGREPLSQVINMGYKSLRIALEDSADDCKYKLPKQWDDEYSSNENSDAYTNNGSNFHKSLIYNIININKITPVNQSF
ncbi:MAG: hypothetical protein V3V19_08250 [Cocleimonas sp.]